MIRGMFLEYSREELAYTYRQQYMFGEELRVAPVTEPGYRKPVVKDTFLPAGDNWYDFFTGQIYEGGQVLSYESPLDRIPVFVRAGSILPLAPEMNFSHERPLDLLAERIQ
jgi:alpha-D-xyloside xylohydrolase